MRKKILTILLISSTIITGLFAYDAPSVILSAEKSEVDYTFKVQKLNSSLTKYEDFTDGQAEGINLSSEIGTTNAFTIATENDGNMHDSITFTAKVTTGQFIDQSSEAIKSGWYPVIEEMSSSATSENFTRGDETVSYIQGDNGEFTSASTGTFVTTFSRGVHYFGTEIARFKLQHKVDDNLVAGSYISTSTIDITTDKK